MSKQYMPDVSEDAGQRCYGSLAEDWIGIECLGSDDCPSGARCCHADAEDAGLNHCALECVDREACVPGPNATCHLGARCEAKPDSRSGGSCVVANPGTACGPQRCSAPTPGCRLDLTTGKGECLALESGWWPSSVFDGSSGFALLQCASPKDCPGERCCIGGPLAMTSCSGECTSGVDVCDSVADCPEFVGPPIGCKPDPDGPAFVKLCQYAWPTP